MALAVAASQDRITSMLKTARSNTALYHTLVYPTVPVLRVYVKERIDWVRNVGSDQPIPPLGGLVVEPNYVEHLSALAINSDHDATISYEDGVLLVKTANSRVEMPASPPPDGSLPPPVTVAEFATSAAVTLPAIAPLAKAVSEVRFACGDWPNSPISGVYINPTKNGLDIVASNSFMLAYQRVPSDKPSGLSDGVVINKLGAKLLPSLIASPCELRFGTDSLLAIGQGDIMRIWSPAPDVQFPDYRVFLAVSKRLARLTIETGVLYRAIRSITSTARDVPVTLALEGGRLKVTCSNGTSDPLAVTVNAEACDGRFCVKLSSRRLISGLKFMREAKKVVVSALNSSVPFHMADEAGEKVFVAMPMVD